jgi:hypothetical protein
MDKIILTHSLSTKDDSNVLAAGSCRSGKTDFFVKPNLFNLKDSVIVIGRDDDKLFEETAGYRQEKFKQKIFIKKDFNDNHKNLDFLGDNFTVYLTAPVINQEERIALLYYEFGWIMHQLEYNPPKNPISVIIDDLALFPVCLDYFTEKIDNVRMIATVQSINDLAKIYGQAESILDSFKVKMFFHINNPDDAEYIVNRYNPQISKEEILQLNYSECLIIGLVNKSILVKYSGLKSQRS